MFCQARAWGNSGSSSTTDYSLYGNGFTRDWLNDGSVLSFEVLGCVWGMVEDSEEAGCLEDESEDGTYNWYMMANCRRPQVAFSVYASSGSASCNNNAFVGSVGSILSNDLFSTLHVLYLHSFGLLYVPCSSVHDNY
jgi:hypothetical protein